MNFNIAKIELHNIERMKKGKRTFKTALLLDEHSFFFIETVTGKQTQHSYALDRNFAAFEGCSDHFYAIG
jgi:hypothetical protein